MNNPKSAAAPRSYEYALSLLCDLNNTSTPGPVLDHVTGFVADLFDVPVSEVKAEVARQLAAAAAAEAAYHEGKTELDAFGDNALED